jgi:tetratricopeptide (TPR) repeat protein
LREVPDHNLASRISQASLAHVLRTDGLDAAKALARRFADRADRAEALSTVALEMAKAGRLSDALSIAHDPLMRSEPTMAYWASQNLAEVHARGGERVRARAFEGFRGPTGTSFSIRVIADTVALDFDAALARLAQAHTRFDRSSALDEAVEALYLSGRRGLEDFLARLAPEDLPRALGAIGRAQVDAGNLPDALATLARLRALPTGDAAHHNLQMELAPFLARKGKAVEAVAMAAAAQHPWTTALVAAEMR